MSHPKEHEKVKIFSSIIFHNSDFLKKAIKTLSSNFASVSYKSDIIPFSQTSYYSEEMGDDLQRVYLIFDGLHLDRSIIDLKLLSYEIEKEFSKNSKRLINIDPGYITLASLNLVTFKDFSHRIHIGKNVYAETTLIYRHDTFEILEWTYPDYRDRDVIEFFNQARNKYHKELRGNI